MKTLSRDAAAGFKAQDRFLREGKKPDQQVVLLTPIAITSDNLDKAERLSEVK